MPPAHLAGCELIQIMECNFCVILLLTEQIFGEDCVLATLLVIKDTKMSTHSCVQSFYLLLEEVRNGKKWCN